MINGSAKWTFSSNGVITSSPLAYNGTVYVGSFDKYLYALDTARGTLKWKANINGQIECSPVIDDLTKLTGHNSQISGYTN
jgi:outer membrane protein assembly factor BamB